MEGKMAEAKAEGANTYRNQAMVALPMVDMPEVQQQCLILWKILAASKKSSNFWKDGRRVGIDSDSSLNIALKGSEYFHPYSQLGDPATVGGVGGQEELNVKGEWIMSFRVADGSVSVLKMDAYESMSTELNIISANALAKKGFNLVMGAPEVLTHLRGKNPKTSPEGHALVTPSGQPIWLKIVHGILVCDMAEVKIKPSVIPHDTEGEIQYLSRKVVKKRRIEKVARDYREKHGGSYADALTIAQTPTVEDEPKLIIRRGIGRI